MNGRGSSRPLTDVERRRVAENLPLVKVHLRERVGRRSGPMADRVWDDLFQEGCFGLIQAVQSYPADSDVAFAAYALSRIHNAVSKALRARSATLKQPVYPRRAARRDERHRTPTTVSLDFDPPDRRAHQRHELDRSPGAEPISERIRRRYVEAVRQVAEHMQRTKSARPDRAELLHRIVEQRILVPDPHDRVSLRSIARETGSSYARVLQCDRRLTELVRSRLADDVETQRLREVARRSRGGMDTPIDAELDRHLRELRVERFLSALSQQPPSRQGMALLDLIQRAGTTVKSVARGLLNAMPGADREALLDTAEDNR
jgi:DNA-directed RNA polymerase specialized sigma subunit